MAAPADLAGAVQRDRPGPDGVGRCRPGRLTHRVGERQQVVAGRAERVGVRGQPQHLPARGGR